MSFPGLDWSDESIEKSLQRMDEAWDALRLRIGYHPLCTDCLYEKTGVDLRRSRVGTTT